MWPGEQGSREWQTRHRQFGRLCRCLGYGRTLSLDAEQNPAQRTRAERTLLSALRVKSSQNSRLAVTDWLPLHGWNREHAGGQECPRDTAMHFVSDKYEYRRRLPHYQTSGRALFVTFCKFSREPFSSAARDVALRHWQPVLILANNNTGPILSLCYDFHLKVTVSSPPCPTFNASTVGDNGNVYQIVNNRDGNRTQNFAYDPLNRISQAYTSGPNWGEIYTIDAWGNLTNIGPVAGKANSEQLNIGPAFTNNQLPGFGYDAAGNVTSDGVLGYTYDMESHLTKFVDNTSDIYVYDGDGQRVKKNASGITLYWYGASGNVLDETNGTGNLVSEYIYFNGKRIARRDADNTVKFYFSDNLGSASVITDSYGDMPPVPGSPLAESDYYPYGGEMVITSGDANHYKFTGKERDTESGLDNFGARYDASSLGRFMTPDPISGTALHIINPQRWNMYAYVMNNPMTYTDPDGRDAAVATFHNMVLGAGHAGIISIHGDGTATYARTGPAVSSMPVWKASTQVSYDLPTVQFGQDGYPTPASIDALTDKVAGIEGETPDSVGISYYKTSEADTIQLDNLIQNEHDHPGWYNVFLHNCEDLCDRGLRAAGRNPGSGFFHAFAGYIPNLAWYTDFHADRQYSHETEKKKEKVTHKVCWTDDQGKQHCE